MITGEMFYKKMAEIDQELRDEEIDYYGRPLHAFSRMAIFIDPEGTFPMTSRPQVELDDFSNNAIFTHVERWYADRYGERTKKHIGPGSYVLLIKGEPWEVIYPAFFGQNNFTIDSDITRTDRKWITETGQSVPSVNILWHVKHITQTIANELTGQERVELLNEYMFGLNAVQALRDMHEQPYMKQAYNDFATAVHCIFYKYPNFNASQWASLQFTEKSMKSKLKSLNVAFPFSHNLSKLGDILRAEGIDTSAADIARVQCGAGIRYDDEIVSSSQAISAVQSALRIFSSIFKNGSYEIER